MQILQQEFLFLALRMTENDYFVFQDNSVTLHWLSETGDWNVRDGMNKFNGFYTTFYFFESQYFHNRDIEFIIIWHFIQCFNYSELWQHLDDLQIKSIGSFYLQSIKHYWVANFPIQCINGRCKKISLKETIRFSQVAKDERQ